MDSSALPALNFDSSSYNNLAGIFQKAVNLSRSLGSSSHKGIELECRLGVPSGRRSSPEWDFNASVEKYLFFELKKALDSIKEPTELNSTVTIKTGIIRGKRVSVRKISPTHGPTLYQTKERLDSDDVTVVTSPMDSPSPPGRRNVYVCRVACSEEEDAPEGVGSQIEEAYMTVSESESLTRQRVRYQYNFGNYVVDLTIVDGKTYEVELEFSRKFLLSIDPSRMTDLKYLFTGSFFPPIKTLFKLMFPTLKVVTSINAVREEYPRLVSISGGGDRREDPQPMNIAVKDVPKLLTGYSWTNKLNGNKYRLLITKQQLVKTEMYLAVAVSPTDIKFLASSTEKGILSTYIGTLAEFEYFVWEGKAEVHLFDCLVFREANTTMASHNIRLDNLRGAFLEQMIKVFSPMSIRLEIKNFVYGGPGKVVEDLKNISAYMYRRYGDSTEEANDGLIATPVGSYRKQIGERMVNRTKTYYDNEFPIYKWKFPRTVSIDFFLSEIKNGMTKKGTKYRVFNLLVKDRKNLVPFGPYYMGKMYNPPSVLVVPDNDEFSNLSSGLIAELGYDEEDNSFILMRVRDDKTEPNSKRTAELTFIDMDHKFTLTELADLIKEAKGERSPDDGERTKPIPVPSTPRPPSKPCLLLYRKYMNKVKEGVIMKWARRRRVLDLGSGRGGDIDKYEAAGIKFLWAVEPNKNFISSKDGFSDRLSRKSPSFQKNVEVVNLKAEQTKDISERMIASFNSGKTSSSQASLVTSFFSMSFFYESRETLESLVETISRNLEIGGYFAGTMMDGDRVYKGLQSSGGKISDKEGCWYIQGKYDPSSAPTFGLEIGINLSDTPTVLGEQKEWLSFFDQLEAELSKRNCNLVETLFLDDPSLYGLIGDSSSRFSVGQYSKNLSPGDRSLAGLYRYFVFRKQRSEKEEEVIKKQSEQAKMLSKKALESIDEPGDMESGQFVREDLYPHELYRAGVIGKGSCFYHSILYLLVPSAYGKMTESEKDNLAANLRRRIAGSLTPAMFASLAHGSVEAIAYVPYLKKEFEQALISGVRESGEEPDITAEKISEILAGAMHVPTVKEQADIISGAFSSLGYDEGDVRDLIQSAREKCLKKFKANLENCSMWTTPETMEYVMRIIDHNIFIVKDTTGLPQPIADCALYKPENKSLVILNLEGTATTSPHFEPLCDAVEDSNGDVFQTTSFEFSHPLIKALYDHLCTSLPA